MKKVLSIILLGVLSLFFSSNAFAQTGIGGVLDQSDILFNFSSSNSVFADAGITAASNGSLVQQWNDLSGNDLHLSQTNASSRPTFVTNVVNEFPVLRFDGSSDFMLRDFSPGIITNFTCIIVQSYDNQPQPSNNYDVTYTLGNSATNYFTFSRSAGNASPANSYYAISSNTIKYGPAVSSGFNIYTQEVNTSSVFHKFFYDGALQSVADFSNGISVARRINLGRSLNASFPHYFDGDLLELVFIDANYNTTQNIILQNHYAAKYGLNLSDDRYSLEATHGNEVAGIGQTSATDNHTAAQGTSILLIENPAAMADGKFAMWGHDAAGTGTNNTDFMSGDTTQLNQEWRWDETGGDVGAVDVTFDMTGIAMGTDPLKYILIATDDGDFTTNRTVLGDGNAVGVNNLSVVGDLITFSNVDLTDLDYFTIAYNGQLDDAIALNFAGVQENWSSALTWDINQVPDSSLNAIIFTGGNDILVDVNSTINDLTVQTGSSLTVGNGVTFQIFGDLVVEAGATFTCNTGATVSFESISGTQRIINSSTNLISFYNLNIDNPLNVALNSGPASVSSALDLVDGTFTLNDNLTFVSDASVTGHIETVSATANLTGNIIAERFADTRNAGWNDIASPAVGSTIADLDDDLFISGVSGADGYASSTTGGGFVSIYKMNNVTQAWEAVANVTDAMTNGVGFEIWLADNMTNWNGGTWTMPGTINLSDVAQQTLDIEDGWNLVGNPFPAFLDFESIANTGNITNNEFWTVEAVTNTFVAKDALQVIPPGQGFWVLSNGGTDLIVDPTTDFVASNSTFMYKNDYMADEEVRILIQNQDSEKPLGSNVYLRKNQNAYAGADYMDIPALKRPEPKSCHIAFDNLGKQNLVNYVSTNEEHLELPLNMESGMAANFTMTFEGIDQFSEYQCINLVNDATGEKIPLTSESKYEFKLGENEPVNMRLILSKEDYADCLAPSIYSAGDVSVTTQGKTIFTDFSLDRGATAQIQIIDMLGNTIVSETRNVGYNRETFNLENAGSGVYLISVTINGDTQTEKVILQ
jgi:hypothetical protein